MTSSRRSLLFYVNSQKIEEPDPDPTVSLLEYLRRKLRMTGTKVGCGEGGCGACTVMISKYHARTKTIRHISVNACLMPLCAIHGLAVTTVEGIGSIKNGLHPVQEILAKSHGTQCGFCTPGIVMSMYTLLRNNPLPSTTEMNAYLEGNLCRCTGYRPILEGFNSFTKEHCSMGQNCCRKTDQLLTENGTVSFNRGGHMLLDPTQDPIFPAALRTESFYEENLHFKGENIEWFRPCDFQQLLQLKTRYRHAKLVAGNTEIGIEIKQKNRYYPILIDVTKIPELTTIKQTEKGMQFGSSVSLSNVSDTLSTLIEQLPDHQTRIMRAIVEMLKLFAGHQIRNVATLGGNIVTASPISDLNPLLSAAEVVLEVSSTDGSCRSVNMSENFFVGYRETKLQPDDILLNITIPYASKNEYFGGYKQAHRREDDIAIVNAGFRVVFHDNSDVIEKMYIAFGGIAAVTIMAEQTMKEVVGRKWDDSLIPDVCKCLTKDVKLNQGDPGGMVEYRRTLTTSFFFKFYLTIQLHLHQKVPGLQITFPGSNVSATVPLQRGKNKSTQIYEGVPPNQLSQDPVGRTFMHRSATKQVTGEALFVDDMPLFEGELYLALVTSEESHAKLLRVDADEAMKMKGVVDFISHKDVPGANTWGISDDEEVFASTEVVCIGQIIGAVVADTKEHAKAAARKVHVQYQKRTPIITIKGLDRLSYLNDVLLVHLIVIRLQEKEIVKLILIGGISEAIKHNSYFGPPKMIFCGDVAKGFKQSDHIKEGEVHIGGQEHFYLETHTTLAVPRNEDGEMELFTTTQNPCEAQMSIAKTLGVAANKIVVRVKRLGGGFGGKETRTLCISLPVATAAYKLKKPVRCVLDRDEDMMISGTRSPFLGQYKVGFTNEGKILSAEVNLFCNAGCSLDLSGSVMGCSLLKFGNAYKIENVKLTGRVCKTNITSNTAFRGFGAPQSMLVTESFVDEIASFLDVSHEKVRQINMYKEGDLTHFGQPLECCNVGRCWEECLLKSDYTQRRKDVEIHNRKNRWTKKGICIIPVVFGCSFEVAFLNQAGALVIIYKDGSILLTHGGVEMGQGLHTKMIQVASRVLRVSPSKIHTSEISTNTVPNASSTAASSSSDLNGMAVQVACQTLLDRLEPYRNAYPEGSWEDWVVAAYFDRISLSATGFYKTPDITGYDFETQSGQPFNYFSYGASCSEVEIDCLTGDHKVIRTDIVMDVGCSLNPAIDIGQIEGAFIQGYGMMMLEQQKMSPDGFLLTKGPGTYKIPGFGNIPEEFNVSLLKGSINERAVYSSKAIGEPPLLLSASVFFAVKDAIRYARVNTKQDAHFTLNSPATPERIRMPCIDQFTEQFPGVPHESYKPWFVNL